MTHSEIEPRTTDPQGKKERWREREREREENHRKPQKGRRTRENIAKKRWLSEGGSLVARK